MSGNRQLQTTEEESLRPQELFNEQWKVYQKLLNENFMKHRDIYDILHNFLVNYFPQAFKMLDFGCGDASFTAQALLNTNIAAYKGVDLSTQALEIAKENMTIIPCESTFIQGDFSQLDSELISPHIQEDKFDVILISFALHHFQLEQKEDFISQLKHLLKAGGVFILIDVFRREEEDRETYLTRYRDNLAKYCSTLTVQDYSMIENHISSCDFPETQQTLYEISQKQGFNKFECLYHDDNFDASRLLCIYK
ncbi:MAG: class I SAM-dependent methyltransferase [Nostoc sp.]|uniref:class I SAM-dependent methyltransferase n=2 Tax=Nostoc TaxID=1177 RepID=UPI002FF1FC76